MKLDHCYIGIEDNKPEAIANLSQLAKDNPEITIVSLDSKYPKGAERVLIYETTGKVLPPGKLPAEVGVIVSNVTSVAFLGQYFRTGMPLIQKKITVDGDAVTTPKNVIALIGTQIFDIIEFCGGYKKPPKKIIMGGPMMGRAIYHDGNSLIKNNNAILAFSEDIAHLEPETPCINCGRCTRACPLFLMPTMIAKAFENNDVEALKKYRVSICMECGSCTYVCPAKKQLNMINRLAKIKVKEAEANGKI
jgi:electron transport complex protein RnfC